MKYQVRQLDVWGNDEEGYTVNDTFDSGVRIEIDENDSDEIIIEKTGYMLNRDMLHIEGEFGGTMYIEDEYAYPLCELRPE